MAPKLVKTTPFTIEEIWEMFNELSSVMVETYHEEEKVLKDEFGNWLVEYSPNAHVDENDEIKNGETRVVKKTRPKRNRSFGQSYSFNSFMRRVLTDKDADLQKPQRPAMFRQESLRATFRWWYNITEATEGG